MPQSNDEIAKAFMEVEQEAPNGLTKREWFAGLAMQGFCAATDMEGVPVDDLAAEAVMQADALLEALRDNGGHA
ncbi:MAG: hypothetical protein UMU75_04390 [Halomonas sp.]|nr:hypothetical protein [Halomonas sp.]